MNATRLPSALGLEIANTFRVASSKRSRPPLTRLAQLTEAKRQRASVAQSADRVITDCLPPSVYVNDFARLGVDKNPDVTTRLGCRRHVVDIPVATPFQLLREGALSVRCGLSRHDVVEGHSELLGRDKFQRSTVNALGGDRPIRDLDRPVNINWHLLVGSRA